MINIHQLARYVITPTLEEIPKGYSPEAVTLLLMIAAHESNGGEWIAQIGNGPARGIYQIELATHDDVWKHSDSIHHNARFMGILNEPKRLFYDLRYQTFVARQKLFMVKEPLPTDLMDLAAYAKEHWNTQQGKATPNNYFEAYMKWSKCG